MKILQKKAFVGGAVGMLLLAVSGFSMFNSVKGSANNPLVNIFGAKALARNEIKASLASSPRALPDNYMCFDSNSGLVKSWHDPNFLEQVKQLSPSRLRLPNAGDYWDWKRGGYVLDTGDLPDGLPVFLRGRDRREYSASKLEDFQAGLAATGTKPLWVLNMLSSNLDYQLEMLRTVKKMGMPVEFVELGNELYFPLPNVRHVFPTPDNYAKTTVQWVSAIKKEFPQAKIAVVGAVSKPGEKSGRIRYWNERMFKYAFPAADAMTLHFYPRSGLDEAPPPESGKYPLFTENDVPVILSMPFKTWHETQNNATFQNIPKNKEIWITEYNVMDHGIDPSKHKQFPRLIGTWVQGMYISAMSLLFLEDQRITLACNYSLVGSHMFGAIQSFNRIPLNMSRREFVPVTRLSLTAGGEAMRVVNSSIKDMKNAQKIDFSQTPMLTGKENFQYPALYGWMFTNSREKRAVILNSSGKNLTINISSFLDKPVRVESVSSAPTTFVSGPNQLTQTTKTASGVIDLPAYSVTKVSNELK